MPDITMADLFCGIGGFRLAFEAHGCRCVYSCDIDRFACQTYNANFGDSIQPTNIKQVEASNLPDFDVLTAGYPCPSFSTAGVSCRSALNRKHGFEGEGGDLFFEVIRILDEKRPSAFLLENVKNLTKHDRRRTFRTIVGMLEDLSYHVSWKLVDAATMVPQHRERIFIAGTITMGFNLMDVEIPRLNPRLGDILDPNPPDECTLSDNLWNYLKRHKEKHRALGHGFGYCIADLDGIAKTLPARYYKDGSNILMSRGDGLNPRRLSVVEAKRIMGYPEIFQFPVSDAQAYRLLGNSVVPPIVEVLAGGIVDFLQVESPPR